jgi:hypothetical protein
MQDECLRPFDLAYDTDVGIRLGIVDSAAQILAGNMSSFWRVWGNLEVAPNWFQQIALQTARGIDQGLYVFEPDLQMHIQQYRAEFSKGNKVVTVAHSQGNLYANEAYNVLYNGISPLQTRSFGIVSVANPASFVAGDGPHTTFFGDIITLVLFALLPNTPSDGVGVLCSISPWCLHGFADAYLEGTVSRNQILQDIVDVISGLEFPPPEPAAHYLSFRGGNPGIPGDGVVVHADTTIFPDPPFGSPGFTLNPTFSLSGITNGITVSVFPPNTVPLDDITIIIGLTVEGLPVELCSTRASTTNQFRLVVNGVEGIAAFWRQTTLESIGQTLPIFHPQCPPTTVDKMRLSVLYLSLEDFVRDLDAAAVGIGINVFPK